MYRYSFKKKQQKTKTSCKTLPQRQPRLQVTCVNGKYYLFHFYLCQGCDPRVYSSSCNKSCPINCKDNMCQIQYGACFVCMAGWMGTFCNTSKESQTLDKIIKLKIDVSILSFMMWLSVAYKVKGDIHLHKYLQSISQFISRP